jgi:hypothetical protein
MTLLVAWVAVDKTPASIYIAADSRISWSTHAYWDHAQKVFCSPETKEIFGYCGDVIFPTQTLSQLCQIAPTGVLFSCTGSTPEHRIKVYTNHLNQSLKSYPKQCLSEPFDILYACCYAKSFYAYQISFDPQKGLAHTELPLPPSSDTLAVLGTGKRLFKTRYKKEPASSYGIFHAFGKTLDLKVARVGGNPQLVSLYRNGKANLHAISYRGSAGLIGVDASALPCPENVEWRNENFEAWDPLAGAIKKGTQRMPRVAR